MSHTPGPWTRTGDERFRHDRSAGVMGPDGTFVAAALDFNRDDRDGEVEANARLIAAAPVLLATLESIRWMSAGNDCAATVQMIKNAAERAVAIAEGRLVLSDHGWVEP